MTALPDEDPTPLVRVRLPVTSVWLRYWLLDLTSGTPHRVDGWLIDTEARSVRFLLGEPESYL